MSSKPITHLMLGTTSSDEHYSGDCDYCLVAVTPKYVVWLLEHMNRIARMGETDNSVYSLACWDGSASYLRFSDKLVQIPDTDGNPAADVPRSEPILLAGVLGLDDTDFQRVECGMVHIAKDEVWWSCVVKHTDVRIETAHVGRDTLRRIHGHLRPGEANPASGEHTEVHPALQRIHDLLYLDHRNGKGVWDPDKEWSADTIELIAEVVAELIPRPPQIQS